jgi:deoxycytidine triphosphate deaminase
MLLNDCDLRNLLPKMSFDTGDGVHPFKPDDQIQPCSIDLRLDTRFWVPRKQRRTRQIDFRKQNVGELEDKRLYDYRCLKLGEGVSLKPGELLLGRTFEEFTIPNGYAGKLEARSTFARIGLSIHCTGDFINPGWRGRMPLQLVNHSNVTLILTPHLPIAQLLVVQVSHESAVPYGTEELGSKYMNDEGTPSRYWLDARIKKLQKACGRIDLTNSIYKDFVKEVGLDDADLIDRFSGFVSALPNSNITNAADVLDHFASADQRRYKWAKTRRALLQTLFVVPPSAFISSLFRTPYGWGHYALWAACSASVPFGLWLNHWLDLPAPAFAPRQKST